VATVMMIVPDTPVGVLNTAAQMFAVARPLLEGRIAAASGATGLRSSSGG
jgi:hypothetical protein